MPGSAGRAAVIQQRLGGGRLVEATDQRALLKRRMPVEGQQCGETEQDLVVVCAFGLLADSLHFLPEPFRLGEDEQAVALIP